MKGLIKINERPWALIVTLTIIFVGNASAQESLFEQLAGKQKTHATNTSEKETKKDSTPEKKNTSHNILGKVALLTCLGLFSADVYNKFELSFEQVAHNLPKKNYPQVALGTLLLCNDVITFNALFQFLEKRFKVKSEADFAREEKDNNYFSPVLWVSIDVLSEAISHLLFLTIKFSTQSTIGQRPGNEHSFEQALYDEPPKGIFLKGVLKESLKQTVRTFRKGSNFLRNHMEREYQSCKKGLKKILPEKLTRSDQPDPVPLP